MKRSFLRVKKDNGTYAFYMCKHKHCESDVIDDVYSLNHAADLGWTFSEKDAKDAGRDKAFAYCPEHK